jgi:hypothetical protein
MTDHPIPTDPEPDAKRAGVPDELLRPIEDRIADSIARKAELLARMNDRATRPR